MFNLSSLTHYLIADIRLTIINELSRLNIPENTIDLADVVIFDNAAIIINDLIQQGYNLVDTKDSFRNELLWKNYSAIDLAPVIDINDAPDDYEKIKIFMCIVLLFKG